MAIRLGITGGIGSGKSVVSKLLELMGVPMYISDDEAKRLMNQDEHIRQQLEQWFGPSVYENGTLNRSLLARSIFGHPERMAQVNGMVHPVVKRDFQQWVASHADRPLVGMESAILIEAGFQSSVDCLVMVYAPLEVRLQRVLVRDAATEEQVKKRMAAQMSDENKREQADFVIVNDGRTPLIPQVLKLISLLSKNNHYLCAP